MVDQQIRMLLLSGMIIFLIGLLNGVVIPLFLNKRIGLSAHLAAVQNGLTLLAFAYVWQFLDLSEGARRICLILSIYSMYAIWFGILLSAMLGTSKALPIAGKGFEGTRTNETIVNIFLYSGSVAIIIASIQIIFGLI